MSVIKKKPIKQFKLVRIELRRLRRLYDACIYSFLSTRDGLQEGISDGQIGLGTKITVHGASGRTLAYSPLELFRSMKTTYPEMLRESLLVRAVSQIENFLVDLLREISRRDLGPFRRQDKIHNLSQAHILSFDTSEALKDYIVENECRALNGRGFREFEKYYKRYFRISFSEGPIPTDEIEEIYARRHLLVHAGGLADKQYCKRFGKKIKPGMKVDIDEAYFLGALASLEKFAEYCAFRVDSIFPIPIYPTSPQVDRLIAANEGELSSLIESHSEDQIVLLQWISVTFATPDLLDSHLSKESVFGVGSEKIPVSDMVVAVEKLTEVSANWLACGQKNILGSYISFLTYQERKGIIKTLERKNIPIVNGFPKRARKA